MYGHHGCEYYKIDKKLDYDPTTRKQTKLQNMLKKFKEKGEISKETYHHLRPTGNYSTPPKFYGSPKIHKKEIPVRSIVSSVGTMAYNSAKYLAKLFAYLVGSNGHNVGSTKEFVQRSRSRSIQDNESQVSFDICKLFSCIPKGDAVDVLGRRLEEDDKLNEKTDMSIQSILELLPHRSGVRVRCSFRVPAVQH